MTVKTINNVTCYYNDIMKKKILIVEDEVDILDAVAEAVDQAGFSVIKAENGATGLELAKAEHPDLILLDIVMPVMDGHTFLKKLRLDPWGKDVKVITLTSMDDVENIAAAHDSVITDYLIKAHSSLDDIVEKIKMEVFMD